MRNAMLVRVIGTKSNRSGIGTRLTLTTGERRQMREVQSGSSYLAQNDLRAHFGLGAANRSERLEIRWPSGATEVVADLPANHVITVREGEGVVGRMPFRLAECAPGALHWLVSALMPGALLAVPSPALAQRDPFFSAARGVLPIAGWSLWRRGAAAHGSVGGDVHGARPVGQRDSRLPKRELRSRLQSADAQTKLQIHTTAGVAVPGARTL